MLHFCAVCKRSFEEAGFCPFDGSPLTSMIGADQQTLQSMAMPVARSVSGPLGLQRLSAESPTAIVPDPPRDALKTDIEMRRGTFPLTPSAPSSKQPAQTGELTKQRPVIAHEEPAHRIHSQSASESPAAALEMIKAARGPSEYDKLVGQTLDGRYFVERKIGEGGMGVVFSARHAVIERPLAIKVLKREATRDQATIRRFVQEAKAASRIGHPNIVDVTDFGTTPDGMTFSVMEFVAGHTLGAAIRAAAPFPPPRALKIAVQIARALGAAHDKGIVHRDLKPENVFLVDRDGRTDFVKIVDFGIAKVTPLEGAANEPRLTRAGSVFGTPEYMAPEQAAGRGDTDGRVDIYALGVILYEMLVGRVPHRGDSTVRTLAMQMLDAPEPPRKVRPDLEISPELEAIVMKMLAKKREQRYQTMSEVIAAVDALQTAVGYSVTGSPVYALTPLPPGADAAAFDATAPAPHTPAHGVPYQQPISVVGHRADLGQPPTTPRPRPKSTTSKLKHEPQFTASDRPATFEHVFADDDEAPTSRRWPLIIFFAVILGGAAGVVLFIMKSRSSVVSQVPPDAAIASTEPPKLDDAGVVVPVTPVDASELVVTPPARDGGVVVVRPRDAGASISLKPPPDAGKLVIDPSRIVRVQVVTKPERARLYQGTTYRGEGGATLDEAYGTRMDLTCRNIGYKPGAVTVVFDGKQDLYVCELTRIKICIDNIKNPFDDCELDPTKPIPPQPGAK